MPPTHTTARQGRRYTSDPVPLLRRQQLANPNQLNALLFQRR